MHGFGVEDAEISAAEIAAMWPLARTDDVLSGFYVADEGRADPVGQCGNFAGQGRPAARCADRRRRRRDRRADSRPPGDRRAHRAGPIETEIVVNAAGMWARQFGALAGVSVPLQAAEHYYLLTDTVPGMDQNLPVIEDPDNYGYYRPEGDGMLVGLFEPVGAPWSLDGVARDFSFGKLPPDWERMEPFLGPALARIPCLTETGVRTFFCGPESFTADVKPLIGPAPEPRRLLRRRRAELARHLVRRRRRQRRGAVDRGRRPAGGHRAHRHRPHRYLRDIAPIPPAADRRAARRALRRRGVADLETVNSTRHPPLRHPRPARGPGSPLSGSRRAGSSPSGSPGRTSTRRPPWTSAGRRRTTSWRASTTPSGKRLACST